MTEATFCMTCALLCGLFVGANIWVAGRMERASDRMADAVDRYLGIDRTGRKGGRP